MALQFEAVASGNLTLDFFDAFVDKLFNAPALRADQVVMMAVTKHVFVVRLAGARIQQLQEAAVGQ